MRLAEVQQHYNSNVMQPVGSVFSYDLVVASSAGRASTETQIHRTV